MKVVLSKVVMAALMALLAINGASAAGPVVAAAAAGVKKLPFLPFLPFLPLEPNKPKLPVINPSGVCPAYQTQTSFTNTNLIGIWKVYQQSPNHAEIGWTCSSLTYGPNPGNTVTYSHTTPGVVLPVVTSGIYIWPTPPAGAWTVQLPITSVLGADSMGNVNQFVISSDLTSYMIIRSCTFYSAVPGLLGFNFEYVYVLTKVRPPTAATIAAINAAATAAGINPTTLQLVPC